MEAFDFKNQYADLLLFKTDPFPLVYGPFESRRFGHSIGINPLGSKKICSFDCGYCSLGKSELRLNRLKKDIQLPSTIEILSALQDYFTNQTQSDLNSIIISGNGEPTIHPDFQKLIEDIQRMKHNYFPQAKVVVLTNGAYFDSRKVIEGLRQADQRLLKIDSGNDKLLKQINNPLVRMSIDRLLAMAKKVKDLSIQSLFVQGVIDNTLTADVEEWIEVVGLIRPKQVFMNTLTYVPTISGLKKVDEDTLHVIATKLERRTGIKSVIFP